MYKCLGMATIAFALVGCDARSDNQHTIPADNTKINVRDRESSAVTPFDQTEGKADRIISQDIRKKLMANETLSFNAKNIKIITIDGVVYLRGPVDSSEENLIILNEVRTVSGIRSVNNQLDVLQKKP